MRNSVSASLVIPPAHPPTRSPPCRGSCFALPWRRVAPGFALRARATACRRRTASVPQCACFSVGGAGSRTLAQMRRSIPLRVLSDREHYDEVMQAVLGAERSVWVATANLKDVMVEDPRVVPGRRRGRRSNYRSVLEVFSELAQRGLELRILHASAPSRAFRRSFDAQARARVRRSRNARVPARAPEDRRGGRPSGLPWERQLDRSRTRRERRRASQLRNGHRTSPPTSRRSIRYKNDTIEYGAAPNAPPAASEKNAKCPSTKSRDMLPPPNPTDFNKLRLTPAKIDGGFALPALREPGLWWVFAVWVVSS